MLCYASTDGGDDPIVMFDHYVPVTVTWPGYFSLDEPPDALMCVSPGCIVEVKTRRGSFDVVELVVVTARPPALEVVDSDFRPHGALQDGRGLSLRLTPGDELSAPRPRVFRDCLVLAWSELAGLRWRRAGGVLCGLDPTDSVLALAVPWTRAADRAMVLG